jgi:hypothetical protein
MCVAEQHAKPARGKDRWKMPTMARRSWCVRGVLPWSSKVKSGFSVARMLVYLVVGILFGSLRTGIACADEAPLGEDGNDAALPLIQQMIGVWDVRQRMWPGEAAKAIDLPPAVAHRILMGSTILQEVMTPASRSGGAPFTRVAYFDYNAVNRQYEYFSLDTRAPQMMNERSVAASVRGKSRQGTLTLHGSRFVAPQWGEAKNVPFRYRIVVDPVEKDRQAVRLYFTPQSGANAKEFLAFEYVYTRKS